MLHLWAAQTNTDAHAMHARRGMANGRATMRARKPSHAHARAFASDVTALGPVEQPWDSNKDLARLIMTVWAYRLTPAERAAWAALAAGQPIVQDDGTVKLVTAQRFFMWFWSTNYNAFYQPPFPMTGVELALMHTAPAWSAPHPPTAIIAVASAGFAFGYLLTLQVTPGESIINVTALVPNWFPTDKRLRKFPSIRILCFITIPPDAFGVMQVEVFLQGLIPFDGWQVGRLIILRTTGQLGDLCPSAPLLTTWP